MNILLYHPKTDHEKFYQYYWVPYSLLTIASGCVKQGFHVTLIDANAKDEQEIIENLEEMLKDTICVGISCMTGINVNLKMYIFDLIRMYRFATRRLV